jgi:hypothetical protein
VGFPEGADAEEGAEAAAHGRSALGRAYKPSPWVPAQRATPLRFDPSAMQQP